jgi:hypothetical protein
MMRLRAPGGRPDRGTGLGRSIGVPIAGAWKCGGFDRSEWGDGGGAFAAHEFEAGEEGAELWLGEEHFLSTGTGGFVEHIDDVEEEEGALGGGGP